MYEPDIVIPPSYWFGAAVAGLFTDPPTSVLVPQPSSVCAVVVPLTTATLEVEPRVPA